MKLHCIGGYTFLPLTIQTIQHRFIAAYIGSCIEIVYQRFVVSNIHIFELVNYCWTLYMMLCWSITAQQYDINHRHCIVILRHKTAFPLDYFCPTVFLSMSSENGAVLVINGIDRQSCLYFCKTTGQFCLFQSIYQYLRLYPFAVPILLLGSLASGNDSLKAGITALFPIRLLTNYCFH